MADYIVDASVVVSRLIRDSYTPHAQTLFSQWKENDKYLIPEFCLLECTNVIWKQIQFNGLPKERAAQLVTDLLALPLELVTTNGLLKAGLEIGVTHHLAVYDSVYIALAKQFNYPLITIDQRQLQAAKDSGIMAKPLTDF